MNKEDKDVIKDARVSFFKHSVSIGLGKSVVKDGALVIFNHGEKDIVVEFKFGIHKSGDVFDRAADVPKKCDIVLKTKIYETKEYRTSNKIKQRIAHMKRSSYAKYESVLKSLDWKNKFEPKPTSEEIAEVLSGYSLPVALNHKFNAETKYINDLIRYAQNFAANKYEDYKSASENSVQKPQKSKNRVSQLNKISKEIVDK